VNDDLIGVQSLRNAPQVFFGWGPRRHVFGKDVFLFFLYAERSREARTALLEKELDCNLIANCGVGLHLVAEVKSSEWNVLRILCQCFYAEETSGLHIVAFSKCLSPGKSLRRGGDGGEIIC
jgi:hypothetical protein